MPAPRRNGEHGGGLLVQLNASVPSLTANNLISLRHYYRSADLLLRQAAQYRAVDNQEQLYVMLLRFASLVVETMPKHQSFQKADPSYSALRKRVLMEVVPELERLKLDLSIKGDAAELEAPFLSTKVPGTTLLRAGTLPEVDWHASTLGPPPQPPGAALGVPQPEGFDLLASPPYSSPGSSSMGAAMAATPSAPSINDLLPQLGSGLRLPAASSATLSKHSVLPSAMVPSSNGGAGLGGWQQQQVQQQQLPWQQVQYPHLEPPRSSAPAASPLDAALASLDVSQQQPPQQGAPYPQQVPPPSPYAELQLGPQEVGVHSVAAPSQPLPPGASCDMHAPPQPPTGVAEVKRRQSLRDVHVSVALMDEFLRYALRNTQKGIETCALLGGTLSPCDSVFNISTLIIPKQKGTTDTVEMLQEEEYGEVMFSREVYPLGWIHTHPVQDCFLSSVDADMAEAVAVVMAPRDPTKRVGIFRLTTPGGLDLIKACERRGFHAHPPTGTGQEIYELCGHVYLNPRIKFEVVDLR